MKLIKFLFFIGLIYVGWYAWNNYIKDIRPVADFVKRVMPASTPGNVAKPVVEPANVPHPEIKLSANGFKSVPWIEGVEKNEIVILGPT